MNYKCPCCLFDMMKVRLDKRGRPMFQCGSCGTIIFARLGDVGIHTVCNVLRMLASSPEAVTHVRAEALRSAEQPGSVLALLSPVNGAPVNGANGAAVPAGKVVAS